MKTKINRETSKYTTKPLASLARLSWNLSKNTGKAHRQHLKTYVSQCLTTAKGVKGLRSSQDLAGLSQEFINHSIDYGHRSLTTNLSVPKSYSNWLKRRSEGCELNSTVDENNESLILY